MEKNRFKKKHLGKVKAISTHTSTKSTVTVQCSTVQYSYSTAQSVKFYSFNRKIHSSEKIVKNQLILKKKHCNNYV